MNTKTHKATVRILDEVNCVILGLQPSHYKALSDKFALRPPNHRFNPKFKLGVWDGYIRYFSQTGQTHVYLLPEIIPLLKSLDYTIEVDDLRSGTFIEPPLVTKDHFAHIIDTFGQPVELRPYQVELVNALISNGGGIGIAGTGAGKTLSTAVLADAYVKQGLRVLVTVPDTGLVIQTRDEYRGWGLDVGEYSGDAKDIDHEIVISTWQALQNNPTIIKQFSMVIVDEAQGLRGQVLQKLLNDYGKHIVHRFGVTGTLPKAETDAMAVRIAVGDIQYTIPAHELIEQGWLATLHIDVYQLEEDMRKQYAVFLQECEECEEPPVSYAVFKRSYFPDYAAEKKYLQTEKNQIEWIAQFIEAKRDAKKGNVFCLVDGIQFGKRLAGLIEGAVFVHGKDKSKARKEVYDLFENNDNLVVIATVNVASTGLNIQRIFNLVFINVGKSFVRVIQTIGRGLRKAPDKDHVDVSDICCDLKYSKKHLAERIKYYNEAKYPYKVHKIPHNDWAGSSIIR